MHIVSLTIESFKPISAAYLTFDERGVTEINGRNGAGKTSILDAIEATIGGARCSPKQPIKKGAFGSKILLKTDEFTALRKWAGKTDTIEVRSLDGVKLASPQDLLNKLFVKIAFDPLAFSMMKPKEQVAALRSAVGLDTSEMDKERAEVYAARTLVNRELESKESQLRAVKLPALPETIGEERDLVAISERKTAMALVKSENDKVRRDADEASKASQRALDERVAAFKDIERIEAELALAKDRAQASKKNEVLALHKSTEACKKVEGLVDPNPSEVDLAIKEARQFNAGVRSARERVADHNRVKADAERLAREANAKSDESKALTARLESIDNTRMALMAAAKFPVPGMSINDKDEIMINDVPFEEASTSQMIRTGLAVAEAMSPKLRVILIRNGSLLDQDAMQEVRRYAEEKDLQIIMERIERSEGGVGFVIEDGAIVKGA